MSVITEIEKKYRVLDTGLIKDFLKPMSHISSGRILDQYLDTVDGHYYQRGIFIRTRNGKNLDVKFNPDHINGSADNDHVFCSEYTFEIPFQESSQDLFQSLSDLINIKKPAPYFFENFLTENQLYPLVTLDKTRTTYENDHCIIAVDDLEDFGTFIEFEAKDSGQSVQDFVICIDKLTKGLPLEPIASGYVEFALRQTNEVLYRKGKYLLDKAS